MPLHEQKTEARTIEGLEMPLWRQNCQFPDQGFGFWIIGEAKRRLSFYGGQWQKEKPQFKPKLRGLQRTLRLEIQVLPVSKQNRLLQSQERNGQNHQPIGLRQLPHLSPAHSLFQRRRLQEGQEPGVLLPLHGLWWVEGEGQQKIQQGEILLGFGLLLKSYVFI